MEVLRRTFREGRGGGGGPTAVFISEGGTTLGSLGTVGPGMTADGDARASAAVAGPLCWAGGGKMAGATLEAEGGAGGGFALLHEAGGDGALGNLETA